MKILHINTFAQGGASKSCIRLHLGLLNSGIDSNLLLRSQPLTFIEKSFIFETPVKNFRDRLVLKVGRILKELIQGKKKKEQTKFHQHRDPALEMYTFPNTSYDIASSQIYQEASIINLHWVADFLDHENFFLKNRKPVIWTIHDMNPFLGGEHYAERFIGLNENGSPIKRKYTNIELRMEEVLKNRKTEALKNFDNLHIVAPSRWLLNESKKSSVLKHFPHHHIPYGLPTDIFKPHDKNFSRQLFNLPMDKIVILFVADSLTIIRKGYIFLKKALEKLNQKDVILCTAGGKSNLNISNNEVHELDRIYDERLMSILYSAADLFIIPSLEDNLPNTVIESLACGTPVIGFPTGGILEMIEEDKNGKVCKEISVPSLRDTIESFIHNGVQYNRGEISTNAHKRYSLQRQANDYINLYKNIMDS